MSTIDTVKADLIKAVHLIEPLLELAALVQHATGVGGLPAEEAIALLVSASKELDSVVAGHQTAQEASVAIATLRSSLAADDRAVADAFDAADVTLDGRFRTPVTP
jgi:hypothetical protein